MKAPAEGIMLTLFGIGQRTTLLRAIACLLAYLCGQQPALAICISGAGDTPECRYIALCKLGGVSQASCSCSFKLAQEAYPNEQIGAFVEIFEALTNDDSARVKAIQSRLGVGVIEFNERLNSVMSAAAAKCGR